MSNETINFNTVIERKNTDSLKYDFAMRRGMPEDVMPLWVADMDFKTSPKVLEAIQKRVEHGIFGYTEVGEQYFEAIHKWMKKKHNWDVERNWLVKTPGVVFALAMAIKAYTNRGDAVLIQQPVYYPFHEVIEDNERKLIDNTLVLGADGKYHMDLEDFERKVVSYKVKLFILCSPHNPVGRVWTKDELKKLGDICNRHDVIVVSDEIHQDFVFYGTHHVFASISEELKERTVTCTSSSKTFNLAGLQTSNIFIANQKLRRQFRKQIDAAGYSQMNTLGLVACEAAYRYGEDWHRKLMIYLKENIDFTREYLKKHIPMISLVEPEGTYLVWLDFRRLNLNEKEREHLIVHEAGLWLDSGLLFGETGEGFERINIACPRRELEVALKKIKKAIDKIILK